MPQDDEFDEGRDCHDSYYAAVAELRKRLMVERLKPFVYDNEVRGDDGKTLGTFSGHWPACAAMLRLSDPGFRSLGSDAGHDLAEERRMVERITS